MALYPLGEHSQEALGISMLFLFQMESPCYLHLTFFKCKMAYFKSYLGVNYILQSCHIDFKNINDSTY